MGRELFIPNLIEGYRVFKIIKGKEPTLGSLYVKDFWQPGLNTAICRASTHLEHKKKPSCPEEKVPTNNCGCGLQAYYFLGEQKLIRPSFFENFAIGLVLGGGRVRLHHDGWRAEKAIVSGLVFPSWIKNKESIDQIKQISERYQVPIFSTREDVRAEAQKYSVNGNDLQRIGERIVNNPERGVNLMTELSYLGFNRERHLIYDFYNQDNKAKKTVDKLFLKGRNKDNSPEDIQFRKDLLEITNSSLKTWQKKLIIKLRIGNWRKMVGALVAGLTIGLFVLISVLFKANYLVLAVLPFALVASTILMIKIIEVIEDWAEKKIKEQALKSRGI